MTISTVQGYCPACGHSSLFLGSGGYITCSMRECPNPTMASDILDDREIYHVVTIRDGTFTIRHPLRERHQDRLACCGLHDWLMSRGGPPTLPGRYRVYDPIEPIGWAGTVWEPLLPAEAIIE